MPPASERLSNRAAMLTHLPRSVLRPQLRPKVNTIRTPSCDFLATQHFGFKLFLNLDSTLNASTTLPNSAAHYLQEHPPPTTMVLNQASHHLLVSIQVRTVPSHLPHEAAVTLYIRT